MKRIGVENLYVSSRYLNNVRLFNFLDIFINLREIMF